MKAAPLRADWKLVAEGNRLASSTGKIAGRPEGAAFRFAESNVNRLSESTSGSLLAPTCNPINIGKVLGIPGQARDDGRRTFSLTC